jgi:3-methyladenine DNA glycosylase AlkD
MEATWTKIVEEASDALTSEDSRSRFHAITRLAEAAVQRPAIERERIVERLEQISGDREPFIRWTLAMALGQIAHPRGLATLERLAADAYTIGEHFPVMRLRRDSVRDAPA